MVDIEYDFKAPTYFMQRAKIGRIPMMKIASLRSQRGIRVLNSTPAPTWTILTELYAKSCLIGQKLFAVLQMEICSKSDVDISTTPLLKKAYPTQWEIMYICRTLH